MHAATSFLTGYRNRQRNVDCFFPYLHKVYCGFVLHIYSSVCAHIVQRWNRLQYKRLQINVHISLFVTMTNISYWRGKFKGALVWKPHLYIYNQPYLHIVDVDVRKFQDSMYFCIYILHTSIIVKLLRTFAIVNNIPDWNVLFLMYRTNMIHLCHDEVFEMLASFIWI